MQSVIGLYHSFDEARRAVRLLEQDSFSIQDVVIADERLRTWRRSRLSDEQGARTKERPCDFLVIMNGEPDRIARATALLLPRA